MKVFVRDKDRCMMTMNLRMATKWFGPSSVWPTPNSIYVRTHREQSDPGLYPYYDMSDKRTRTYEERWRQWDKIVRGQLPLDLAWWNTIKSQELKLDPDVKKWLETVSVVTVG